MVRPVTFIIVIACLAATIFGSYIYLLEEDSSIVVYSEKISIENRTKIKAIPEGIFEQKPIYIKLEIETNQYPEALDYEMLDNALLVDDEENTYLPLKWDELSREEFSKKGILHFPPLGDKVLWVKLVIFDDDNYEFSWDRQH